MAGMTFATLRSHVLSALVEYTGAGAGTHYIDSDVAGSWVKLAIYRLDADLRWTRCRAYDNSIKDQRYYTLPVGFHEILVVTYQGKPLERITSEEEIARADASPESGTPLYWSWWGPDIALYPKPDVGVPGSIGLYVVSTPVDLADDETPTLPAHLHPLLIDYALSLGHRHVGDAEKAVAFMNLYSAAVEVQRYKAGNDRGTDNRVSEDVI
ncbi:MAG: phage adaptor protein [Armatimonadota bacterium]